MYSILHITDLHRAKSDPISNAELISALVSDRDRYGSESPPIKLPQAIVVSGDVIQGVGLGQPDWASELEKQYNAAFEFLVELTERFLSGDRSKVIIIPGNHDIDWNCAFQAMTEVADKDMPSNLPSALHDRDSPYRWDWKSRKVYIVSDPARYKQRLDAFWKFFSRFYDGVEGLLRVEVGSDANLYSLDDGRIAVAAFSSCNGNDCFSFLGEIPREVVARSHLDLKELGPWRLCIATWHHDIEGPPHRSDYMDPDIVRGMIGKGFRLGLYGHQHRPQITPQHIYLPDKETIAISSAGSLCAGQSDLPVGARRGYSIIEIGDDYKTARIHVREMVFANLFSKANLGIFGGESFVDLEWRDPIDAAGRPVNTLLEERKADLMRAEGLLKEKGDARQALNILSVFDFKVDLLARGLILAAAEQLDDHQWVVRVTDSPLSIQELVLGVEARLRANGADDASAYLALHMARLEAPPSLLSDLTGRIELSKRMKP